MKTIIISIIILLVCLVSVQGFSQIDGFVEINGSLNVSNRTFLFGDTSLLAKLSINSLFTNHSLDVFGSALIRNQLNVSDSFILAGTDIGQNLSAINDSGLVQICPTNRILKSNSGIWECAVDSDTPFDDADILEKISTLNTTQGALRDNVTVLNVTVLNVLTSIDNLLINMSVFNQSFLTIDSKLNSIGSSGNNLWFVNDGKANLNHSTAQDVNISGNMNVSENVSAAYFLGDGSQLTGIQRGNLILYFLDKDSDDILNNKTLSSIPNATEVTYAQNNIGDGSTQFFDWITDKGVPNINLIEGNMIVNVEGMKTGGTKQVQFYYEVYITNSSGENQVLIGTSGYSIPLTTTRSNYNVWVVANTTRLNLSDRIMVRGFSYVSGDGSSPSVEAYVQGASNTRLEIPVGAVSVEKYIPYTGALKDVDLGNHNLTVFGTNILANLSTLNTSSMMKGDSIVISQVTGLDYTQQLANNSELYANLTSLNNSVLMKGDFESLNKVDYGENITTLNVTQNSLRDNISIINTSMVTKGGLSFDDWKMLGIWQFYGSVFFAGNVTFVTKGQTYINESITVTDLAKNPKIIINATPTGGLISVGGETNLTGEGDIIFTGNAYGNVGCGNVTMETGVDSCEVITVLNETVVPYGDNITVHNVSITLLEGNISSIDYTQTLANNSELYTNLTSLNNSALMKGDSPINSLGSEGNNIWYADGTTATLNTSVLTDVTMQSITTTIKGDSADLFITQSDNKYSIGLLSASDGEGIIRMYNDAASSSTGQVIQFAADRDTYINTGHQFGIGTDAPNENATVHIKAGENGVIGARLRLSNNDAGAVLGQPIASIDFENTDTSAGGGVTASIMAFAASPYGGTSLNFSTSQATSVALPQTRMVIQNDGRIAIGKTNSSHLLDVNGDVNVTGGINISTGQLVGNISELDSDHIIFLLHGNNNSISSEGESPNIEANLVYDLDGKFYEGINMSADLSSRLNFPSYNNFNRDEGTISFWFKPAMIYSAGNAIETSFFKTYPSGANHNVISFQTWRDDLGFQFNNNAGTICLHALDGGYGAKLEKGVWHHIAGTWVLDGSAAEVHLYVDGDEIASQTGQNCVQDEIDPNFDIGTDYDGTSQANGTLDEFIIRDKMISQDKVIAEYLSKQEVYQADRMTDKWTYYDKVNISRDGVVDIAGIIKADALIDFYDATGDKILFYSTTYGMGVNSGELTNWVPAGTEFSWRTDSRTGTEIMDLDITTGNLKLKTGELDVDGTGTNTMAGGLTVGGSTTLGNLYTADQIIKSSYEYLGRETTILCGEHTLPCLYYRVDYGSTAFTCSALCTALGYGCEDATDTWYTGGAGVWTEETTACASSNANSKFCVCYAEESCFPAGSQVTMFDGVTKNIEDVKVGESVMSYDEETKEIVSSLVTNLEQPYRNHIYTIEFSDGSQLRMTDEHPILTKKGWASINPINTAKENSHLDVIKLEVGDYVKTEEGYKQIIGWLREEGGIQTYNLKNVKDTHTYFVEGSLVHNKCYKEGSIIDNKRVEDIKVGDIINGKKVIRTFEKTMLEPIKGKIVNDNLTVTHNHIIDGVEASQTDYPNTIIYGTVYDFEVKQ